MFSRLKSKHTFAGVNTNIYEWMRTTLCLIRSDIFKSEDKDTRLAMCDFLLYLFKMEIKAASQTRLFTKADKDATNDSPILYYYLADGTEVHMQHTAVQNVPLSSIAIDRIAHVNRLRGLLQKLKSESFQYDPQNHVVCFLKPMNISFVESGRHSLAVSAYYYGDATIKSDVYDYTEMFDHTDVSAAGWVNIHTGNVYAEITDKFFAVIYYIERIKFLIINDRDINKELPRGYFGVQTSVVPRTIAALNAFEYQEELKMLETRQFVVDTYLFSWSMLDDEILIKVVDKDTSNLLANLLLTGENKIELCDFTLGNDLRKYQILYYAEINKSRFIQ